MKDLNKNVQEYHLSTGWRISYAILIASLLLFFPLTLMGSHAPSQGSDLWIYLLCGLSGPIYFLIDIFRSRLIAMDEGLVEIVTFWYRKYIPWSEIDSLIAGKTGGVYAVTKFRPESRKNQQAYCLSLSRYADLDQIQNIVEKVSSHSPSVKIDEAINGLEPIPIFSTPGIVGSYYVFSLAYLVLFFVAFYMVGIPPLFLKVGGIVVWGMVAGIFNGAYRLIPFTNLVSYLASRGDLEMVARDFYLLPITGGLLAGTVAGIVALGGITPLEEYRVILIYIAMFLSFFQHKIFFPRNLIFNPNR